MSARFLALVDPPPKLFQSHRIATLKAFMGIGLLVRAAKPTV